jgi:hypothetical protein
MVALLTSGAAQTLEEAYDQAQWARPDIRAILEKERADAAAAEQRKRDKAQAARLKGGSVRGGPGSAPVGQPGDRTLRQELEAGFAEARGRV